VLSAAGFHDVDNLPVEELMWFGDTAEIAYEFIRDQGFTESMLDGRDDAERARALAALRADIADHVTPDGVLYASAAWIVHATKG
jgi:hypothetical protein